MQQNKLYVGLGGGRLVQWANREGAQMMSYLIETPFHETVVIDGGHPCEKDARHLYETLMQRGAVVDLWLITHAHNDHYGVLYWMLKNIDPFELSIKDIRFAFPPLEWLKSVENGSEYHMVSEFYQLLETRGIVPNMLRAGDTIPLEGCTFDILSDCSDYSDYTTINDTTSVILVHFPKKDVLFLGDLGPEAGRALLSRCDPVKLRCDIVQMAHHGQRGVDRHFYETVRPKVCLYPAPDWLWDNNNGGGFDLGPWETVRTREWMEELGALVSCPSAFGDYILE